MSRDTQAPSSPTTEARQKAVDLIYDSMERRGWSGPTPRAHAEQIVAEVEQQARDEGRREAVRQIDTQAIVDAALPTAGTEGPYAWTDERIRDREAFARELHRILDRVAGLNASESPEPTND